MAQRISGVLGALGRRFDPSPAQWVKDPALPQLWLRSELQLGSDPWPQELRMPRGGQKKGLQ